jgi:hypothetical protein
MKLGEAKLQEQMQSTNSSRATWWNGKGLKETQLGSMLAL